MIYIDGAHRCHVHDLPYLTLPWLNDKISCSHCMGKVIDQILSRLDLAKIFFCKTFKSVLNLTK